MQMQAGPLCILAGRSCRWWRSQPLQRILQQREFAQTAVIVSEFGEIGLDHHLLASTDDTIVLLPSGCMCCAVRSDLVATLLDLHWRSSQAQLPPFKRVIIETSGLADPAPVIQTFMTDADIAQIFYLEGILTLVDAVHGPNTLDSYPEACRQLAVADKILITKTDLTDVAEPLQQRIAVLNPTANWTTTARGELDLATIFGDTPLRHAREPSRKKARGRLFGAGPIVRHTSGIESFTLERDEPVPALALTLMLQGLAEHCGENLLRFKGLVHIAEMPERPAVVHGGQHIFNPPTWLDRWPDENRSTRMIFIGMGVPRRWPKRLLELAAEEVHLEVARQEIYPMEAFPARI
jgi:G3E family GTPase